MTHEQQIEQKFEQLQSFIVLVETFETIAGTSVRRIRNSVLANRAFHEGLNQIYHEITQAYNKEVLLLMKKKNTRTVGQELSLQKRIKKTAFVFISSNTGLYGDIILRIFSAFIAETKRIEGDIIIVGRMGRTFFEETAPGQEFTYFDFPDNAISVQNLKTISNFLASYEKVVVFYALFKNILTQEVKASLVSGTELPTEEANNQDSPSYFFEPSLEEVTLFFEKEIFASLLEQIFQESRLAKLASRMILLDRALVNTENELKRTILQKSQIWHRKINHQLLNSLSGVVLWG